MEMYDTFFLWMGKKLTKMTSVCFVISLCVRLLLLLFNADSLSGETNFENILRWITVVGLIVANGVLMTIKYNCVDMKKNIKKYEMLYGIAGGIILPIKVIVIFYVMVEVIFLLSCCINYIVATKNCNDVVVLYGKIAFVVMLIAFFIEIYTIRSTKLLLSIPMAYYFVSMPKVWDVQERETNYYSELDEKVVIENWYLLSVFIYIFIGFCLRYWSLGINYFEIIKGYRW